MHGRCSKRRRSTRQRSGRCFDCCSRPLCLHRASTRPAIPRASWTVERLIDRSDVETTAPEGKREYAGAVEASCAATEPSWHPVPIDLSTPWTGLRSFFLLAFKARARDLFLFRACPQCAFSCARVRIGQPLLFPTLEVPTSYVHAGITPSHKRQPRCLLAACSAPLFANSRRWSWEEPQGRQEMGSPVHRIATLRGPEVMFCLVLLLFLFLLLFSIGTGKRASAARTVLVFGWRARFGRQEHHLISLRYHGDTLSHDRTRRM